LAGFAHFRANPTENPRRQVLAAWADSRTAKLQLYIYVARPLQAADFTYMQTISNNTGEPVTSTVILGSHRVGAHHARPYSASLVLSVTRADSWYELARVVEWAVVLTGGTIRVKLPAPTQFVGKQSSDAVGGRSLISRWITYHII
jgi:hypothetical protein